MNKTELRRMIREKKRAMTPAEIEEKSARLGELLRASEAYRNARSIYGYLPYNQEIRTWDLLAQALKDGKQVAVPKVYGEVMRFIYIDSFSCVDAGYCGIPEPVADEPVADDPCALVLMPGLAFDKNGGRIGYGGGYYDKFLAEEPNHPTVALCYGFQVVENLPAEEFDIPVDLVIWS